MATMRLLLPAALAATVFAPPALSEAYVGGNILSSEYEYEDVHRGSGNKLYLGYHFETVPIQVEVVHLDLGDAKVDDFAAGSYTFTDTKLGWNGNVYSVGLWGGRPGPFAGWLKVGIYDGDATLKGLVNAEPFSFQEKNSGAAWGLGFEWAFSNYVGAVFDLEGMSNVKTIGGADSTVTLYSLGLIAHFGANET